MRSASSICRPLPAVETAPFLLRHCVRADAKRGVHPSRSRADLRRSFSATGSLLARLKLLQPGGETIGSKHSLRASLLRSGIAGLQCPPFPSPSPLGPTRQLFVRIAPWRRQFGTQSHVKPAWVSALTKEYTHNESISYRGLENVWRRNSQRFRGAGVCRFFGRRVRWPIGVHCMRIAMANTDSADGIHALVEAGEAAIGPKLKARHRHRQGSGLLRLNGHVVIWTTNLVPSCFAP